MHYNRCGFIDLRHSVPQGTRGWLTFRSPRLLKAHVPYFIYVFAIRTFLGTIEVRLHASIADAIVRKRPFWAAQPPGISGLERSFLP